MKKFLLGILVGLILAAMSGVVLFFAALKFADRTPSLPAQATLALRLSGPIPEGAPLEIPFPGLEDRGPISLPELYEALSGAAVDNRIKAVWLEPRGIQAGWGKLDEIRTGLERVRKAGKPVYAFLQGPSARDYYLASAADRVFMTPEDLLDLKGMRIEATYYKGTLDKIGVQVEVEHVGRYKDAGDVYTRTSMTPETREVLNSVLDVLFGRLVGTVATARKKTPDQVRTLIDQGPFLAPAAKAGGLIDALAYRDEVEKELKEKIKTSSLPKVSPRDYLQSGGAPGGRRSKVALLVAQGDIIRGSAMDLFGEGQYIAPDPMRRQIRLITEDPTIKGVILRVDSPGGDAIASDEILREVRELSRKKPLVISMSDVAASGGYYISMTGDPVVAYPGTLTGSIGVVYGKINLTGLYDKLGISKEILKRGRFADIDSESQPLTPEGRKKLQEGIESIYAGFLKRVSEGRRLPVEQVDRVAQGRVWLGEQALGIKLVDELGGLDQAVALVKKKANIPAGEPVKLIAYPGRRSLLDQLFRQQRETEMTPEARSLLSWIRAGGIAPWLEGGMLRVMPYRLEIR
jgi:protease IV